MSISYHEIVPSSWF